MIGRGIIIMTFRNNYMALLVFAISLLAVGCSGDEANPGPKEAAKTIIEVETAEALTRDLPTYMEASGNLSGDEQSDVAPAVGGKIVEVRFDIGSFVKKGDLLVRLDPKDAEIRVDQAKKAVEQAIANLRQTQSRLGVSDGEVFEIERFSQVRSVKAQLDLAERELARASRLLESGDVSQSVYEARRSQRDALLGQLDEARSNASVAIKAIETARAVVVSAESQVATAEKFLADTRIVSPITGYVSERNADVGEFISPNVPNSKLATIVRTNTLRMRLEIPEQAMASIERGQSVIVQVGTYPDRKFAGRIVRISPVVNTVSRLLIAEAEIDNRDGLLKPGQFATARITQSRTSAAVMVPTDAIRTDGSINKIFVIENGVADERIVQLGLIEGDLIEIKQGVSAGEVVAISGLSAVGDGMSVKVK
jgi:multidrug efflux pump subunit AcrA (membrane-fusion protein)